MISKERPRCRKVILRFLEEQKGITLKDIAYPDYDNMKILTSDGLKLQARKMLETLQ